MKEKEFDNNIEELLIRYCEGTLSNKEKEAVEDWIASDKEHEVIARNMHELYWAADTLNVIHKVDTERALKKVKNRMVRKSLGKILLWTERVAAVLFLPLLLAYILKMEDKSKANIVEVRTNPGMTTAFVLPDGTNVSLNSGSVMRYPEFFSGDRREVELVGEAYFDVVKDEKKRFVVKTSKNERVEVLGTSFNMEAFPEDSVLSTTLIEGKVNFICDAGSVQMTPGEKLVYNTNTYTTRITKTNGEVETAWRDGKIVFDDTPFDEALRMLSKRFNVDFVIKNKKRREDSFTGTFTTQQLDQILGVFSISSKIRWRYMPTNKTEEKRSVIEVY